MEFRPCIDIHNGKVKQIVGATLKDGGAAENFVSEKGAAYFAKLYKKLGLAGGHVIILNRRDTPEYASSKREALSALAAFEGGMMAGGGINDENAGEFLDAGASHVIVTSFIFSDGELDVKKLERMKSAVGKDRLCIDLSCRKKDGRYYVVTDRWQRFSGSVLDEGLLEGLSDSCDEFLVHAADVEGRRAGIDEEVIGILKNSNVRVTYAGGVKDLSDIERVRTAGDGRVDVTVGSALDIFGGSIRIEEIAGIAAKK
ncbi:MAG: phosphoribosylformimino-5-aminoimidazole carboxamide ribotide isomerase [Lachnospiraceae bacterium]|nr:phosphoribosylformimino-5-aminoimidazole carboxamide ribotide isomerase [Lachnospiraceae bacterium]